MWEGCPRFWAQDSCGRHLALISSLIDSKLIKNYGFKLPGAEVTFTSVYSMQLYKSAAFHKDFKALLVTTLINCHSVHNSMINMLSLVEHTLALRHLHLQCFRLV